jgi:hypothetical protein
MAVTEIRRHWNCVMAISSLDQLSFVEAPLGELLDV